MKKRIAHSLLALGLALSLLAVPASALELEDAKQLLDTYYVDDIPAEILELDSLDAIIQALDDPYTYYMSADEYNQFISSVEGETFAGIGATVQNAIDDGALISSVLPNSPALEAGLEAGDCILAVDGVTLVTGMDLSSLIKGPVGSTVTLTIRRHTDGQVQDYTLVRREVTIPIVTSSLLDQAGYIKCDSFGTTTANSIREALETYQDQAQVWIVDLRENPGGITDTAAGSVGWFAGGAVMVYFRDGDGNYSYVYTLASCPDLTDQPLMVLTSPWSASGSELFAAAVRDLGVGIAIGQRTFGKGVAQMVFDDTNTKGMFDGDCLKITTSRFYSPDGATNDVIGVIPTLVLTQEHTMTAATLLSAGEPERAAGHLKLELAGQTFYISLEQARQEEYQAAFTEILEALSPSAQLYRGDNLSSWYAVAPEKLAKELGLPYQSRSFTDLEGSPYAQAINTLAAFQLLTGYDDGTFRPENAITRAEFCAMVTAALDLPAGKQAAFSDVAPDAWYAQSVSAMASKGFIAGDDDGRFRPDDTITYEEMVTVLASVAGWASMDGYRLVRESLPASEWPDYYQFSDWAQSPARTLSQLGALVGDQQPQENGTRQVAAALLEALMEATHLLWL